jgi:hypothetical protein
VTEAGVRVSIQGEASRSRTCIFGNNSIGDHAQQGGYYFLTFLNRGYKSAEGTMLKRTTKTLSAPASDKRSLDALFRSVDCLVLYKILRKDL